MTATAPPAPPRLVEAEVLGIPVSVLVATAERPRGVVFALHGGASGKEYFDHPLAPDLSLLRLGPALGWTVVAPDRPGYVPGDGAGAMPAAERTDLLYALLDGVLGTGDRGAGVLVLAHSMGCISGIRMAADLRGRELLGLDFSGTGLHWSPAVHEATAAGDGRLGGSSLRQLIWGHEELYPAGSHRAVRRAVPGTPSEGTDIDGWGEELPRLAADVRIPTRYALAEHEAWWAPGRGALAEVAALFTAAPVVETAIETGAGHNISLGWTARAYHLRVLAFAEQCVARRATGDAG
ncbi:alpha/beta hydrolase [Blastococcus sp. TF02A-26]|uniref:alpha/beta hydrolase n=1 Tax=Blastococcus sp. TF02A-26 TaxID=2250577 RepID=UPI000DE8CE1D|nr:alpha/beta hydrolase [Blastococcus sp. TF02A-26]RBY85856.1 alpha/beta hydrolase [Blastococcus sp. TF02A-26]